MRRREIVVLAASLAAFWPLVARAQQRQQRLLGFLSITSPDIAAPTLAAIWRGLTDTGYVDGQNAVGEYRFADNDYDRLPALAADLVKHPVDLIFAIGAIAAAAAKGATSTIPIVFLSADDPVKRGFVTSLARPGANLTGVSHLDIELTPKLVEIAAELPRRESGIALLVNPQNSLFMEAITELARQAAQKKDVLLHVERAESAGEIESAFASLARLRSGALVVPVNSFFASQRAQIAALAVRHAIPTISLARAYALAGGLISYGPDFPALHHQMGLYAGKILNGAKPADLPVEQPTKFELVINLKTAAALGITVPPTLLARADEVIE